MIRTGFSISRSKLTKLYWQRRLSCFKIGDIFGCSPGTVLNLLRKYKIKRRKSGPRRIRISKRTLIDLYIKKGLSTRAIARIYHCDQGVALRALRKYDITVRSPKVAISISRGRLAKLYLEKGYSTYRVAAKYHCDPKTIYHYLKVYKIPTRSPKRIRVTKNKLEHLYSDKKYSLATIAKIYNCHPAAILGRMRLYGISRRSISETSTKHPKRDFVGDLAEKAYILGFRLGDLGVSKKANLIYVSSSTTKDDQVRLITSLFRGYGPVWVGRRNKQGAVNVSSALNDSFSFMQPKYQKIPSWVLRTRSGFLSFLAGYTDAEGNIAVYKSMARFRIRSYDKSILYGLHCVLRRLGVKSLFGLEAKAGIYSHGVKHNKDSWSLGVSKKSSLRWLLTKLYPLLRHGKRRNDLVNALDNVIARIMPS